MPYVRTTITLSVGHMLHNPSGMSDADTIRRFEEGIGQNLEESLRLLLAMAKGPDGIVQWQTRQAKQPLQLIEEGDTRC